MKSSCKLSLSPTTKPTKCSVRVINAMHHGKFHKSRGNVISMAYDEKVIMVILFQFRKNGFVIFLTNTSVTEQLNIWKITVLKQIMLFY